MSRSCEAADPHPWHPCDSSSIKSGKWPEPSGHFLFHPQPHRNVAAISTTHGADVAVRFRGVISARITLDVEARLDPRAGHLDPDVAGSLLGIACGADTDMSQRNWPGKLLLAISCGDV